MRDLKGHLMLSNYYLVNDEILSAFFFSYRRRTQCKILFHNLQEEVWVELLEIFHSQRQALQSGEVSVHCVVQQADHFLRRPALFHCQHGA